jgi:hypothetical protein
LYFSYGEFLGVVAGMASILHSEHVAGMSSDPLDSSI